MSDYRETVHELNDLAIKTRLMSDLSMITIYLLDDPNYSREDAARDLVRLINDLDSVAACISVERDEEGLCSTDTHGMSEAASGIESETKMEGKSESIRSGNHRGCVELTFCARCEQCRPYMAPRTTI